MCEKFPLSGGEHPNPKIEGDIHIEKLYDQPEFDSPIVGYTCNQIPTVDDNSFSVANAQIGMIFGSRWSSASRAQPEPIKNVHILFARLLKIKQCNVLGVFQLPSKFN